MCHVDSLSATEKHGDAGTETGTIELTTVYKPVYVSAVEHPEHFWIQILSKRSTQLDGLIKEMTSFYENQVLNITNINNGKAFS